MPNDRPGPSRRGRRAPLLELQPDLGQVIRYCGMAWAFVPFFYDIEAARRQGMPGTLVPGPLKLGLVYRAVHEWLDGRGRIIQVRAAHRRPDITGDPIAITGNVARVYEEGGEQRADLELVVVNKEGQPSVRAFAVVAFTR
ncbi:MAG: hypothetical protein U5Q44_15275 [Dehalococcoidia bacterium]|nr:hypothetical protein [Dehalococcoidia bacterium]